MLTDEQRLRVYRTPEAVADADQHIANLVDAMPPLTAAQRDALAVLLGRRTPSRPAPAPAAGPTASPLKNAA